MAGTSFEIISFEFMGLQLLEPMALVTNGVMGGLSIYFAMGLMNNRNKCHFNRYWFLFFTVFGISAVLGGLGHLLFNYWGFLGKIPPLILGPLSIFYLEKAMVSQLPDLTKRKMYEDIIFGKLILVLAFIMFIIGSQGQNLSMITFLPVAVNTILGIGLGIGLLGFKYYQSVSDAYRYFWVAFLVMLPSSIVFIFDINLHKWMNKNDLSHLIITLGLIILFIGVKRVDTWKDKWIVK